ncbi:MAG: polyprenyl synthetase family protein [Nitrospinota bacterium]
MKSSTIFLQILDLLKVDLEKLEEFLVANYKSDVALIPEISKHLNEGGGKRLRPVFLMMCSKLCGYEPDAMENHIRYSCVVEFIHAATLLHDDVIDFADSRRGSVSANVKWGNEASILVGDFLFSKSFHLVALEANPKVIKTVSKATMDLAEGEVKELMLLRNVQVSEEDYLDVITRKTASLMGASCKIGAILGNSSDEAASELFSYGTNIGIAFQLMDDIFDITAEQTLLGKPVGNDLKEGNITMPLIYTYGVVGDVEKKKIEEIVTSQVIEKADIEWISALVKERGGINYTLEKAKIFVEKAKRNLHPFMSSEHYEMMNSLADHIINREF